MTAGAVSVRAATPEDAAAIAAIYAPIVAETPISFETVPPTPDEMAGRIETVSATHSFLVAELDGKVVGYAYASAHRSRAAYCTTAEVTVYVAPYAQRRGVGRALYTQLFEKLTGLGIHAVVAGITLPNRASVTLHTALGFEKVGVFREVGRKFGAFHDVGWWQKLL